MPFSAVKSIEYNVLFCKMYHFANVYNDQNFLSYSYFYDQIIMKYEIFYTN